MVDLFIAFCIYTCLMLWSFLKLGAIGALMVSPFLWWYHTNECRRERIARDCERNLSSYRRDR